MIPISLLETGSKNVTKVGFFLLSCGMFEIMWRTHVLYVLDNHRHGRVGRECSFLSSLHSGLKMKTEQTKMFHNPDYGKKSSSDFRYYKKIPTHLSLLGDKISTQNGGTISSSF